MFPFSVRGSVPLASADSNETARRLAELFRGLGMTDVTHHAKAVTFRNSFLSAGHKSRTLAAIGRGALTVEPCGPHLEVRYVLRCEAAVLFGTLVILAMVAMLFASRGPTLGPALFLCFVGWPWMCCGSVVLAKVGFEHWLRRVATTAEAEPKPPSVASVLEAHTRTRLRLETALVMAFPFFFLLLVLLFAVQFGVEQRARARFLDDLNVLRRPSILQLDGRTIGEAELFLTVVRGVRDVQAHHSHPTGPLSARATDGERSLAFSLSQDSERPDEFWIQHGGKDIGRVSDPRLRSMLSRAGFTVR
jgi:hypothetical protein